MIHKKVKFKGTEYWLHQPDHEFFSNLSPIDHYTEDGILVVNPFQNLSFAIVIGDNIMQFGSKIGNVSELEEVK